MAGSTGTYGKAFQAIERGSYFSGEVRLIAFRGLDERVTLIKVCGVYLVHDYDADAGSYLRVPSGNTLEKGLQPPQYTYGTELRGHWSAVNEMVMFEDMNRLEHVCARRNRWTELSARGGFPDLRLRSIFEVHPPLVMPSLDSDLQLVPPIGNFIYRPRREWLDDPPEENGQALWIVNKSMFA